MIFLSNGTKVTLNYDILKDVNVLNFQVQQGKFVRTFDLECKDKDLEAMVELLSKAMTS